MEPRPGRTERRASQRSPIDGILVIDKPEGLTSHDVVAVARRTIGERRIGHTGTLDPLATGVLVLACGRATRLVALLAASEKEYLAEIRFGVTTDSYDITGIETSRTDAAPTRAVLLDVIESLKGDYLQPPPPVSAKKIKGQRAYALARAGTPVQPSPVPVRVPEVELLDFDRNVAVVRIRCSAGFYVRAFAHAAGERAATGACLQALRRTRSGDFTLADAVTLDTLQGEPEALWAYLLPIERLLPELLTVVMTAEGLTRVAHGRDIGPEHVAGDWPFAADSQSGTEVWVRLTDGDGGLVALAKPGGPPGILHPSVVLG